MSGYEYPYTDINIRKNIKNSSLSANPYPPQIFLYPYPCIRIRLNFFCIGASVPNRPFYRKRNFFIRYSCIHAYTLYQSQLDYAIREQVVKQYPHLLNEFRG